MGIEDALDECIAAKRELDELTAPLQNLTTSLLSGSFGQEDKPSAQKIPVKCAGRCINTSAQKTLCSACVDACPVQAVKFDGTQVVLDSNACTGCQMCCAVCPTDALTTDLYSFKELLMRISVVSQLYTTCYISCDKIAKPKSMPNMIPIPCLGAWNTSMWRYVLDTFDNVCVYLPAFSCEQCVYAQAPSYYLPAIQQAEQSSRYALNLEVDASGLCADKNKAVQREEFIADILHTHHVSKTHAQVTKRTEQRMRILGSIPEVAQLKAGALTKQGHVRYLTRSRTLDIASVLQEEPDAALWEHVPKLDPELCTGCEICTQVCPVGACEVQEHHLFSVDNTYCVGCGACCVACPEKAITMERNNIANTLE